MPVARLQPLYRRQELAFSTRSAELKERSVNEGELLSGTPGSLSLRTGPGHAYRYRRYYAVPGKEREDLVCKHGDADSLRAMRQRIESAQWVQEHDVSLEQTLSGIPSEMWAAVKRRAASLTALLQAHPQALEQMDKAPTQSRRR